MIFNDDQRLKLQNMIDTNKGDDNTEMIRTLKQSISIKKDVDNMIKLKKEYPTMYDTDKSGFEELCMSKCSFLFFNYTDIYNKILKNEINTDTLYSFIGVLKQIEDGELNEHDGSIKVGELLKTLYIDSAMRKSKKLDEENEKNKNHGSKGDNNEKDERVIKTISWAEYKKQKV